MAWMQSAPGHGQAPGHNKRHSHMHQQAEAEISQMLKHLSIQISSNHRALCSKMDSLGATSSGQQVRPSLLSSTSARPSALPGLDSQLSRELSANSFNPPQEVPASASLRPAGDDTKPHIKPKNSLCIPGPGFKVENGSDEYDDDYPEVSGGRKSNRSTHSSTNSAEWHGAGEVEVPASVKLANTPVQDDDTVNKVDPMWLGVATNATQATSAIDAGGDDNFRRRHRRSDELLMGAHVPHALACKAIALFTRRPTRHKWAVKVWNFLNDPDSSHSAYLLDCIVPYLTIITVIFALMQSIDPSPVPESPCQVVEMVIDSMFFMEALVRYMVCPIRGIHFLYDFFNCIDILAALPLFLRVIKINFVYDEEEFAIALRCVVPILRLLKMMRRFQKIHLLLGAFKLAAEALPVLMFILTLITLTFSSAVYLVEPRSNIEELSVAIWFTIVTMTTVGYGDVVPVSTPGHCIVAVLTVSSVLYMAMPLGIVGQAFTQVWNDRDRILLVKKARAALMQWGYTAHDIPVLCNIFDTAEEGEHTSAELNLTDFCRMIRMMRIGLKAERIIELFDAFDSDGSGSLDDKELVRQLFPHSYHEIYDNEGQMHAAFKATHMEEDVHISEGSEGTDPNAIVPGGPAEAPRQNGSLKRFSGAGSSLKRFSGPHAQAVDPDEEAIIRRISKDLMSEATRKQRFSHSSDEEMNAFSASLKERWENPHSADQSDHLAPKRFSTCSAQSSASDAVPETEGTEHGKLHLRSGSTKSTSSLRWANKLDHPIYESDEGSVASKNKSPDESRIQEDEEV